METINLSLLLGVHDKCDNTIKKLIQENFNLKKKQNDLFKLLGIKDIDEIYNFIVKKINDNIDKLIKKDEIIKKYQEEIKEWKTFEQNVITFLNKHKFDNLDKLDEFIYVCKCNCISSEEPKINKVIPRKVTLNNCLYNKFKKEKDDRIIKNKKITKIVYNKIVLFIKIKRCLEKKKKDEVKRNKNLPKNVNDRIIKCIIKSNITYKNINSFNTILNVNRNIIDTYSNYYSEFIINKKENDIEIVSKLHDRNKNRFVRLIELYYLIKKETYLYNSNYIFDYCTLAKIHKKTDDFVIFINLLKEEIKKYRIFSKENYNNYDELT
jgi:hypothetical protein